MVRCIVGHEYILVIVEREMDCQNTRDNGGTELAFLQYLCAAGFALLNLPKGKSLGRSKPETNSSNEQAH